MIAYYQMCLHVLGITSCAATIILYIVNREKKLIKATSRELSAFLLAGISLAFLTGITCVIIPLQIYFPW